MKILHFVPSLVRGGAERVVIDLANDAARRGHEVTIVTAVCRPSELMPAPLRSEIKLNHLHHGRIRIAQLRLVPWIIANRKWLLDQDVVHCHLWLGTEFGAVLQRLRGQRQRPAIVETYHAVGMRIPTHHRALHALLLAGRDGIAFMAEDPYWNRYRATRPRRLFRTIPNGVSSPGPGTRDAAGDRKKIGIPAAAFVFGTISRLVDERRPDLIMDAFADIAHTIDHAHLLLAGEGPARPALEAQAGASGLAGRVHLPGLVIDAAEPLGIIDLYLTVAVGPIVGIAALEAALAGLPVLAVQLIPDYRAGEKDWIWSSPDPAQVAVRAIELSRDRGRLRGLAQAQQEHAREHHSVEGMGKAYETFYEEALRRRGRVSGASRS